jgi:hypothetical protein
MCCANRIGRFRNRLAESYRLSSDTIRYWAAYCLIDQPVLVPCFTVETLIVLFISFDSNNNELNNFVAGKSAYIECCFIHHNRPDILSEESHRWHLKRAIGGKVGAANLIVTPQTREAPPNP